MAVRYAGTARGRSFNVFGCVVVASRSDRAGFGARRLSALASLARAQAPSALRSALQRNKCKPWLCTVLVLEADSGSGLQQLPFLAGGIACKRMSGGGGSQGQCHRALSPGCSTLQSKLAEPAGLAMNAQMLGSSSLPVRRMHVHAAMRARRRTVRGYHTSARPAGSRHATCGSAPPRRCHGPPCTDPDPGAAGGRSPGCRWGFAPPGSGAGGLAGRVHGLPGPSGTPRAWGARAWAADHWDGSVPAAARQPAGSLRSPPPAQPCPAHPHTWPLHAPLAGQGLPPGCDYEATGAELAALGLSTDVNASWTGPLRMAQVGPIDFAYYEFGNARQVCLFAGLQAWGG